MDITLVSAYDPIPPPTDHEDSLVGGVERMLHEVAKRMAHKGHDVTIVCSSGLSHPVMVQDDIRLIRVRRKGSVLRAPIAGLARHIPTDTDVVHVAATYPFTTVPTLRRAHELGLASVLDFHFEPGPGSAVGRLAANVYGKVAPQHYKLARRVIVRSEGYARSAPSLAGVPEERWRVVPNGIDPSRFNAEGPAKLDDYILFVGRLVPYKGLSVLLDAMAKARLDIPLYVVGGGPLRQSLEAQAKRLRLDVRFLGRVADDQLPALYRGARFTVLPSVTRQEAFGISLIESMACGTPVLASALPGVADVARFGGIVATPGDVGSLAAALRAAVEPGLERGRSLAKRTHETFSWDAVTERVLDVYREALDDGPTRMQVAPLVVKR